MDQSKCGSATAATFNLEIPTSDEIFGPRPNTERPESDSESDISFAMEIANRECARLVVNCCLFDPPISEEEIAAYARRFGISPRQAELELRRSRDDS